MQVSAKLSFFRVTPRKMGEVAQEIRGKDITSALNYLQFSPRKAVAGALHTLLKSAVANANQNREVDVDKLIVRTILVGKGPTLKRFRPRAKGSAFRILKYTSHVTVTLADQ